MPINHSSAAATSDSSILRVLFDAVVFSALSDNGAFQVMEVSEREQSVHELSWDLKGVSLVFLIVFIVTNIIVMLNLLIAFISDIFDKVLEMKIYTDYVEQCKLMREVEEMCAFDLRFPIFRKCFQEGESQQRYIHICKPAPTNVIGSNNLWEGRMKEIKDKITDSHKMITGEQKELTAELNTRIAEVQKKMEKRQL